MSTSPARARRSAATSVGPSMSTMSGARSSRARRTLRAEPGPWWRMPRTSTVAVTSRELAACAVEIGPRVALLHNGLEVLLPHHAVLHGIGDHRAHQAGGDVVAPHGAVAEVGGEGEPVGDHGDRLRGAQCARR